MSTVEQIQAGISDSGKTIRRTVGVIRGEHEGWAFCSQINGRKAHYVIRSEQMTLNGTTGFVYDTLCGVFMSGTDSMPLFGPGNFPSCKRCERMAFKRGLKMRVIE